MEARRNLGKMSDKILFYGSLSGFIGIMIYLVSLLLAGSKLLIVPTKIATLELIGDGTLPYSYGGISQMDKTRRMILEAIDLIKSIPFIKTASIVMFVLFGVFLVTFIYAVAKKSSLRKKIYTKYNIMFAIASLSFIISIIILIKLFKITNFLASIDVNRYLYAGSMSSSVNEYYISMIINQLRKINVANYNASIGVIFLFISFIALLIGTSFLYLRLFANASSRNSSKSSGQVKVKAARAVQEKRFANEEEYYDKKENSDADEEFYSEEEYYDNEE